MREDKKINGHDIEILNVNKELIENEKHNGFKIKKNGLLMFVKKLPKNIYKLAILLVTAISETLPNFISKVPVVGYAIDAVAAYGKSYLSQIASDNFFDEVICKLFGITVDMDSPDYCKLYAEFTHHKGKYFQLSMVIKTIATFAAEHPGLVIAGGAVLAGLAYKVIESIVKGVNRKIKYNKMDDKQKEVYMLLKDVLKRARKIKKVDNGDVLVKDLNITYEIINHLGNYPDMLDAIKKVLLKLNAAIECKNESEYEKCRLELETRVFNFDKEHDNLLGKEMHLIENPKELDKTDDRKTMRA